MEGSEDDLNTAWAEKAWIQTVADIEKTTGWRLDRNKTLSVEAVIERIKPDKSVSDSTADKAKHVFRQTLTVIQRTGQIVASAATPVFGPSQQCFNAVSFVITAVQDYQSVYEQTTALMERISVFLERFEIRIKQNAEILRTPGGSRSDLPLMQPTYRVLEHFVTVLGRVQKLTHGWKNKMKLFVKVGAFGEDGGIREALGRLETLVQDITQTEIAVIGRDLSGMAKDIREFKRWSDQVLEYAARSDATLGQLKSAKDKEDERREMEKVRKKLGLDDKEPWKRHFEKLSEESISGTGSWLIDSVAFRRWADYNEPRSSVLALRAESNCGKSFLCRSIVDYLLDTFPKGREVPRASVGYYFIRRSMERKDTLNDAIRAIIWQMVQSDTGYAKSVQKECDRDRDFPTTADLWTLVTGAAKSINATFYVVLDGIDELPEDSINWIGENITNSLLNDSSSGGLRLRILLSSRPKVIDALENRRAKKLDTIDLSKPSGSANLPHTDDLEKYIRQRDEWRDVLSAAQLTSDHGSIIEDFPSRLAATVNGNYSTLRDKLRRMEGCKDMDEIQDILLLDDSDAFDSAAQRIENFTATLSQGEAQELNEILAWVSAGCANPKLSIIKQALTWRFSKQFLLERTLTNRYNDLLTIDGQDESKFIRFASDSVEYYFLFGAEEERERQHRDVVRQTEAKLVQQIIKTHLKNVFGNDEMYNRSELEGFFQAKQTEVARRFQLDEVESHARLLEVCVAALCDRETSSRLDAIREYAYEWFDRHVFSSDPEVVSTDVRRNISHRLIRLLREPLLIERWWTEDRMWLLRILFFDEPFCEKVVRWLSDSKVDRHLQDTLAPEENDWVQRLKQKPRVGLFEKIASVLLSRWRSRNGTVSVVQFLRAYARLAQGKAVTSIDYDEELSIPELEMFEEWATSDRDTQWQLNMASTFLHFGFAGEACERCQRATESDPNNWQVLLLHAKALAADEKYNTSMEKFQSLLTVGEPLLSSADAEYATAYWTEILIQVGKCYANLARFQEAAQAFRTILEHARHEDRFPREARDAFFYLTAVLSAQDRLDEMMAILSSLAGKRREDGSTWLIDVIIDVDGVMLASEFSRLRLPFHSTILRATRLSGRFEEVEKYYVEAQEYLSRRKAGSETAMGGGELAIEKMQRVLVKLCHYRLLRFAGPKTRSVDALDGWEKDLLETELDGTMYFDADYMFYVRYAAEHVGRVLLSEARLPVSQRHIKQDPEKRLKKLTQIDPMVSRYAANFDIRFFLARLYLSDNRKSTARHTLLSIMRSALNTIVRDGLDTDRASVIDSFRTIGQVLTALEDDINARVAFVLAAERAAAASKFENLGKERLARLASRDASADLAGAFPKSIDATAAGANQPPEEIVDDLPHVNGSANRTTEVETSVEQEKIDASSTETSIDTTELTASTGQQGRNESGSKDLGVVIPDSRIDTAVLNGAFMSATPTAGGATRYHRVHRDYLSTDTLSHYSIEYEIDKSDTNYIIIQQPLTALEKELMFEHTMRLRKSTFGKSPLETTGGDIDPDAISFDGLVNQLRDEEVFANLGLLCDNCHQAPSDIREWYICRDCLEIALDPGCIIERRPEACDPDHTHLRLTLGHVQELRSAGIGEHQRLVGAENWLSRLKLDWGLDKPALRTFDDILTLTIGVMAAKRFWKEKKYGRDWSNFTASRPIQLSELLQRQDVITHKGGDPTSVTATVESVESSQNTK